MDDDSPDDVALRTLARQLFGDHGARPRHGRRAGDGALDPRRRRPRLLRRALPHRRHDGRRRRRRRPRRGRRRGRRRRSPACRRATAGSPAARRAPPSADVAIDDDSEQVHLAIGGRSVPRDDPDREALDVVNHVFGGGLSSRLFDEIRERRGLAYSVYSATSAYADAGRLVGVRRGDARARRRGQPARSTPSSTASSPTASPTRSWTIAIGYLTGRLRDGPRGHRRPDVAARRDAGHARQGDPGRRAARALGDGHATPTCGG